MNLGWSKLHASAIKMTWRLMRGPWVITRLTSLALVFNGSNGETEQVV